MQTINVKGRDKFLYSLGSIAFGVKDNGFTTFLMIYYNQVLGLSAFYTGLAILIALASDAISDPYVGHLSDNWRSKMGRRHPFMYAAIIPVAISYYFLWNLPAEMTDLMLFAYLTVMAVTVRLFVTFFEIPNSAMIAELTHAYDARTTLTSLRVTTAWLGGVLIAVVAYVVFLVPNEKYSVGVLNLEGYQSFAVVAAIVMVFSMLISALSTHKLIPQLPQPVNREKSKGPSFTQTLKIIFKNKSFRSLFVAALFSMMAFGVILTLQVYFGTFYFGLNNEQISLFPVVMVFAALLSLALTPILSRGYEKRTVFRFLALISIVVTNIPVVFRLMDMLPSNGDPILMPVLLFHALISTAVLVSLQSVFTSMAADLVEDTQRETGHRVEGMYFATISFSRKIVSGLGIFASGLFISFASASGEVLDAESMETIAVLYVPFICFLYWMTYLFAGKYQLSRQDHAENLEALRSTPSAAE